MLDAEPCSRSPEPPLPEATAQGLILAVPQSISRRPHVHAASSHSPSPGLVQGNAA